MNNLFKKEKLNRNVAAIFIAVVIGAVVLKEPLLFIHLGIIAIIVNLYAIKGWPGPIKGALGLFALSSAPLYIFALIVPFSLQDQIATAKANRAIIDDKRIEFEGFVRELEKHVEEDMVFVKVHDIDGSRELGPVSHAIMSSYLKASNMLMPEELGPDPIYPTYSMSKSDGLVLLSDMAGFKMAAAELLAHVADEVGKDISEVTMEDYGKVERNEGLQPFMYSCLIDSDGKLVHLSGISDATMYLDLTDDPIFSKVGDLCEEKWGEGYSHTDEDFQALKSRVEDKFGHLPAMKSK